MLPNSFVWTRFGTESGECIEDILARKERERLGNGGMFLWGIGNSVGPSVRELLRQTGASSVPVLFSPMLSKPKAVDVAPVGVSAWRRAIGLDGQEWEIPEYSLVTSRASAGGSEKRKHYALVCFSNEPVLIDREGRGLASKNLVNYVSGNQVGASQVTCVVRNLALGAGNDYRLSLMATLTYPFVVELFDPQPYSESGRPARKAARQVCLAY